MSKISKYLQIDEKLLLEYTYDINANADGKNLDAYVFKDNTGRLTFYNNPTVKNIENYFTSGFMFTSFPQNTSDEELSYPGFVLSPNSEDAVLPADSQDPLIQDVLEKNGLISEFIANSKTLDVPMEKIRIHLASGYTFNDCLGFVLNIRCYQGNNSEYPSYNKEINLHTFTFLKSALSTLVKFSKQPFYQQSKFYDRYIEFYIPSAYYMAMHKTGMRTATTNNNIFDILNIEFGNQILFNFAKIEDENFEQNEFGDAGYINFFTNEETLTYGDKIFYSQGDYNVLGYLTAQIALNSNSDNFNLRLYEDKESNCIRYYPVWGDPTSDNPVTRKIMNSIENGSIPLSMSGFLDDNDSAIDEFEEIYGEEARRWIVVNQLELQFVYQPMISSDTETDNEIVLSRKFNYTEDFEADNDNFGNIDNIYKFVYRPVIESLNNGYTCNYIAVTYTGRLVNRMNGEEIIRIATLDIENAESKFGINSNKIDVSNIYTWKLFNKNEVQDVNVSGTGNGITQTKYITNYVNAQNFAMTTEDGNADTAGNFTIALYDTEHVYKLRVFTDDTYSEAYQLGEANASILMRVCTGTENKVVYLKPTYSTDMNTIAGELEFKITESMASSILKGNRKWHIVAQTEMGVTTLFAGKFVSVFGDE